MGGRLFDKDGSMRIFLVAACACILAACSSDAPMEPVASTPSRDLTVGSVLNLFRDTDNSGEEATTEGGSPQLGVNSFLWRATLDTINFMPLTSADPVGGVVISDWYASPDRPDERMKITVYILDKRLRADAVKVSVFRQVRGMNGWTDAQTNPDTGVRLENAILSRARTLRLAATPQ
jgi:hypothetical protein